MDLMWGLRHGNFGILLKTKIAVNRNNYEIVRPYSKVRQICRF
jgi:hypothetical protein